MNELWAKTFIDTLVHLGCDTFCIAPGSRSTPLTVAIARNPEAQSFVHFDERGLAFFALGYAKSKGKAVVIVTTSGTAVANLLPAIAEAHNNRIPLLVISADRPHELRATDANQTMRQVGIFSSFTNWEMDMPCPTAEISLMWLQQTLAFAVAKTEEPFGVVHLNCPFREPFFTEELLPAPSPMLDIQCNKALPNSLLSVADLAYLASFETGWIIAGQLHLSEEDQTQLSKFATQTGFQVLTDVGSNVSNQIAFTRFYDLMLCSDEFREKHRPQVILQLGSRFISKRLQQFITQHPPQTHYIVQTHEGRPTTGTALETVIRSGYGTVFPAEFPNLAADSPQKTPSLIDTEIEVANTLFHFFKEETTFTELGIIKKLEDVLPQDAIVFFGNSMPVRYADMLFQAHQAKPKIMVQRGVSGIDGLIATTCGIAAESGHLTVLVLGDLSALHDLNSLSWLSKIDTQVVILIMNNDGGAIFSHLPIAEQKDIFTPFFTTPHGFEFSYAAAMFDISYAAPTTISQFEAVFEQVLQSKKSAVLEFKTNAAIDKTQLEKLKAKVVEGLRGQERA